MLTSEYGNRPERACVKCGILFSGYRCKLCQKQLKKKYRESNREKINLSNTEWRKANPEKAAKSIKNWQLKNPEKRKASTIRANQKRKEQRRIECIEWRKKNADKIKKSWQKYKEEHKDRLKENRRKYEEKFPERVRAGKHTRRARLLDLDSKIDPDYIKFLRIAQNMKCNYCNETMEKYQIDHIFPIAKGGNNDNSNLQLLCPSCNRKKGSKTDSEFREYLNVIAK